MWGHLKFSTILLIIFWYEVNSQLLETLQNGPVFMADPLRRTLGIWGRLLNRMSQQSAPTDDQLHLKGAAQALANELEGLSGDSNGVTDSGSSNAGHGGGEIEWEDSPTIHRGAPFSGGFSGGSGIPVIDAKVSKPSWSNENISNLSKSAADRIIDEQKLLQLLPRFNVQEAPMSTTTVATTTTPAISTVPLEHTTEQTTIAGTSSSLSSTSSVPTLTNAMESSSTPKTEEPTTTKVRRIKKKKRHGKKNKRARTGDNDINLGQILTERSTSTEKPKEQREIEMAKKEIASYSHVEDGILRVKMSEIVKNETEITLGNKTETSTGTVVQQANNDSAIQKLENETVELIAEIEKALKDDESSAYKNGIVKINGGNITIPEQKQPSHVITSEDKDKSQTEIVGGHEKAKKFSNSSRNETFSMDKTENTNQNSNESSNVDNEEDDDGDSENEEFIGNNIGQDEKQEKKTKVNFAATSSTNSKAVSTTADFSPTYAETPSTVPIVATTLTPTKDVAENLTKDAVAAQILVVSKKSKGSGLKKGKLSMDSDAGNSTHIPEAEEEEIAADISQLQLDAGSTIVVDQHNLTTTSFPLFVQMMQNANNSLSKSQNTSHMMLPVNSIIDGIGPLILPLLGYSKKALDAYANYNPAAAAQAQAQGVPTYQPANQNEFQANPNYQNTVNSEQLRMFPARYQPTQLFGAKQTETLATGDEPGAYLGQSAVYQPVQTPRAAAVPNRAGGPTVVATTVQQVFNQKSPGVTASEQAIVPKTRFFPEAPAAKSPGSIVPSHQSQNPSIEELGRFLKHHELRENYEQQQPTAFNSKQDNNAAKMAEHQNILQQTGQAEKPFNVSPQQHPAQGTDVETPKESRQRVQSTFYEDSGVMIGNQNQVEPSASSGGSFGGGKRPSEIPPFIVKTK